MERLEKAEEMGKGPMIKDPICQYKNLGIWNERKTEIF